MAVLLDPTGSRATYSDEAFGASSNIIVITPPVGRAVELHGYALAPGTTACKIGIRFSTSNVIDEQPLVSLGTVFRSSPGMRPAVGLKDQELRVYGGAASATISGRIEYSFR